MEKQLSVDDLVYHGSLVAFHRNQLDCRAEDMPLNDMALYHLLNVGSCDMDAVDKPWDASTCSMRFATCLGDCLWTMVAWEQSRVSVFCFFNCYETEHALEQLLAGPYSQAQKGSQRQGGHRR